MRRATVPGWSGSTSRPASRRIRDQDQRDLLRKGDTRANVMLMPGDVIIIPESAF
jgi:hypothetical protein